MLRVSVVLEILRARISARALVRSKPSAIAPPTVVALRKVRRDRSKRHLPVEPPRNCPGHHATRRPGCQVTLRKLLLCETGVRLPHWSSDVLSQACGVLDRFSAAAACQRSRF